MLLVSWFGDCAGQVENQKSVKTTVGVGLVLKPIKKKVQNWELAGHHKWWRVESMKSTQIYSVVFSRSRKEKALAESKRRTN